MLAAAHLKQDVALEGRYCTYKLVDVVTNTSIYRNRWKNKRFGAHF